MRKCLENIEHVHSDQRSRLSEQTTKSTLRYNTPAQNPDETLAGSKERKKESRNTSIAPPPPTVLKSGKRVLAGGGEIQTMTAVDQLVMTAGGKAARRREQGLLPYTVHQECQRTVISWRNAYCGTRLHTADLPFRIKSI